MQNPPFLGSRRCRGRSADRVFLSLYFLFRLLPPPFFFFCERDRAPFWPPERGFSFPPSTSPSGGEQSLPFFAWILERESPARPPLPLCSPFQLYLPPFFFFSSEEKGKDLADPFLSNCKGVVVQSSHFLSYSALFFPLFLFSE